MKIAVLSLMSLALAVTQAQARECTNQEGLDQAVAAMKTELQTNLADRVTGFFLELKSKVAKHDYAQLQSNDKALDPVKAVQVEAALVQKLQEIANTLDGTAKCLRGRNSGIVNDGEINWRCDGRSAQLRLETNEGQGSFRLEIERTGGRELSVPILFNHAVVVSETYNKMEVDSYLSQVLFPARENGGAIMNREIVKLAPTRGFEMTLDAVAKNLATANQNCQ